MAAPTKRNIVDGVEHMGSFYHAMPHIAAFIEADYNPDDLSTAYEAFTNIEPPDEDNPLPEDHDGKGVWWDNWVLRGKHLSFVICFEKYEMLFGWCIVCPDEETYYRVKDVVGQWLRV